MNQANRNPRILIAGRNLSSNLCMARAFGRAGYRVEVLRLQQKKPKFYNPMALLKPEKHSRYTLAFHTFVCGDSTRAIADRLLSLAVRGEKALLIPTCDLAAAAADEYTRELESGYVLPAIPGRPGALSRLMDKSLQKRLAEQAGLPVVHSRVIRAKDGVFTLPEDVRYPCFLKPNISKNSVKSHMCRCDDARQLSDALARFSRGREIEMLAEEYVEIAREYALLGLSTDEKAICPGFFLQEQGGHGDRKGVTMVGRVLDPGCRQEFIDSVAAFVHGLGYRGLFDVDLIETADGQLYFVELNLRYGASGHAITESGMNLPAMYADWAFSGTEPDGAAAVTPGGLFVSEKLVLDEFARDLMSWGEVRSLLSRAPIRFIRCDDDPRPWRHFRRFFAVGAVTALAFRLKKLLKK